MLDNEKLKPSAVNIKNLTTTYPDGFVACRDINFDLNYNEIHCLLGENGSGKTTLAKTLFGEVPASAGQISVNGQALQNHSTQQANFLKMGIIHQHFSLIKEFTVFENLILGYEMRSPEQVTQLETEFNTWLTKTKKAHELALTKCPTVGARKKLERLHNQNITQKSLQIEESKRAFWLPLAEMKKHINKLNKKFGLGLNIDQKVSELSLAEQQKTEILKLLVRDAQILIFDEPTSVLDAKEIKTFLQLMKNYRDQGKAIIFITHKIEEIIAVGDRVTIMNEGNLVGTHMVAKVSEDKLVNLLAGKEFTKKKINQRSVRQRAKKLLQLTDVNLAKENHKILSHINFQMHKNEIVALAGIEKNGQKQLFELLAGIETNFTGKVEFAPHVQYQASAKAKLKPLPRHWKDVEFYAKKRLGIAYVPQSRIDVSLLGTENLASNLVFNNLENENFFDRSLFRVYQEKNVFMATKKVIKKYQVKGATSPTTSARSLSGGNQQKFVIGRELATNPELLLVHEPTWGIDVLSKQFVYDHFFAHRDQGGSILFASSNMNEILSISDRVLVMSSGQIVGEVNPKSLTAKKEILQLMTQTHH